MLLYNALDGKLKKGIEKLQQFGFLKVENTDVSITAIKGYNIVIQKNSNEIVITYDTEPHFYMALARSIVLYDGEHKIKPMVRDFGFMIDCSRNAVPKTEMLKQLVCLSALIGYTYIELYTEDTYELPDEPYFGYKRGRYTAKELTEIVDFAEQFGLEVIPCIQTLAHLWNLSKWKTYKKHTDIEDILLVGDERTHALIRKCLRFCKKVFRTNKIHIGLDEAFRLGRGRYIDTYGYKAKKDVYIEHFKDVFRICQEEDVEPDFWADAFYLHDMEWDDDVVKAIFNGSQTPIMWHYTETNTEYFIKHFTTLKKYAGKVVYAGAYRNYIGFVPENSYQEKVIDAAYSAVKKCGVDNILMTTWGDNGAECSVYACMSNMIYSAQKIYECELDENRFSYILTGYTSDEWKACENLNHMTKGEEKLSNTSKFAFYNDFLLGIMDKHIPSYAGKLYQNLLPNLCELSQRDNRFSYIFRSYAAFCKVLTRKATYSKRLYEAYKSDNRIELTALLTELCEIKEDLKAFYNVYREQWMLENKGYGFEVIDIRLGGLLGRIKTVSILLNDYINGNIDRIYELEEERIKFDSAKLYRTDEEYALVLSPWEHAYSVNQIVDPN